MSKMFQTVLVMPLLVATLATDAAAEFTLPPPPPTLTLEDIKAARDKFDREMKLETKRPWDGTGWKTPSIDLSPPDKPKTD